MLKKVEHIRKAVVAWAGGSVAAALVDAFVGADFSSKEGLAGFGLAVVNALGVYFVANKPKKP